jgi:hypothetical protein
MMFTKLSTALTGIAALCSTANAAIVTYYYDDNCTNWAGSRNIWDNSCATGMGAFESFTIDYPGGEEQILWGYSQDSCSLGITVCADATDNGAYCWYATKDGKPTSAMSSYWVPPC